MSSEPLCFLLNDPNTNSTTSNSNVLIICTGMYMKMQSGVVAMISVYIRPLYGSILVQVVGYFVVVLSPSRRNFE